METQCFFIVMTCLPLRFYNSIKHKETEIFITYIVTDYRSMVYRFIKRVRTTRERINPETKFQNSRRRTSPRVKGLKRASSRGSFGPIEFHLRVLAAQKSSKLAERYGTKIQ